MAHETLKALSLAIGAAGLIWFLNGCFAALANRTATTCEPRDKAHVGLVYFGGECHIISKKEIGK